MKAALRRSVCSGGEALEGVLLPLLAVSVVSTGLLAFCPCPHRQETQAWTWTALSSSCHSLARAQPWGVEVRLFEVLNDSLDSDPEPDTDCHALPEDAADNQRAQCALRKPGLPIAPSSLIARHPAAL